MGLRRSKNEKGDERETTMSPDSEYAVLAAALVSHNANQTQDGLLTTGLARRTYRAKRNGERKGGRKRFTIGAFDSSSVIYVSI